MDLGDAFTSLACRVIDPVERDEGAGLSVLEEVLDRQARMIRILNDQLDGIEQESSGRPPGSG